MFEGFCPKQNKAFLPDPNTFALPMQIAGADRFRVGSWHELLTGAPVLKGAVGTIECRLVEEIDRYDSVIAIGEIVNWTFDASVQPLVYFSGGLR